ncbi:multidrug effflux MFS transporter [Pectobacterium zantedeschiae]|uniref:Bcr/CflA family efflux transporter n=1 Tax=Pectobacterium zantedeschiae TaxID=2034769 RepID=A0A9X8JKT0_9GAMM|nr:multidrug effflux MFS transporter [Pectobacterium zantedeschiae]RYC38279.1 MFS transporter [Pectobacterium zantedeschiae]RYC44924.1 Bcr/CflA family efflux MFS transporter [Pectobacterium zantedeschiae]
MNNTDTQPLHGATRLSYALVLGLLAALGPLCTDLYLPALPELSNELSTSASTVQLSLTAGLLGLGVGQLLFGPLSDARGRRGPLLFSLAIFLLTSIWCALAPDIHLLIIARFLQGASGAGGAVLSRAIARDLYSGYDLTRFFALLMLINGLAPILAPVMGGVLLNMMDWRGIFIALSAIAILLIALSAWRLQETLPPERRITGGIGKLLRSIGTLLTQREFMGLCLTQGLIGAGMFAYIGASPFVLQEVYQLSPQAFSLCFATNGIGMVIAAQIATPLCRRKGELAVLKMALCMAILAALALLLAGFVQASLPIIMVPLFITVSAIGLIGPCASTLAMQGQGNLAGSASALIGMSLFMLGAISTPLTGINGTSALSMALVIFICYALAGVAFLLVRRSR